MHCFTFSHITTHMRRKKQTGHNNGQISDSAYGHDGARTLCHLHWEATCNYGFKGHVLKYHEIFFSRMLMFHFMALNCITTQIPPSLFFFFRAVHPDACLVMTLRRRITRHTDRAASCRDGENSSHINPLPDYLATVPARRTIRPFEETSSPIRSN